MAKQKLKIRWAEVRPEMASMWLTEVNTHNRSMSQARVALYAADMRNGRWLQAAQPILFSDRGVLLDGQHRLAAIVDSNTTQTMLVVEGLPKSIQLVIDGNKHRDDAAKLKLGKGLDVTPRAVAVARAMINPQRYARKYTTSELAEFTQRHNKAITFACELFHKAQRGITQAPIVAVVARAYYRGDTKRLAEFAQVLYSGINRGEKDVAAIQLRNIVDEGLSYRNSSHFRTFYGKIEAALDAFLRGEALPRLVPAKGEVFPLPGETKPPADTNANGKEHPAGGRLAKLVATN